MTRKKGSPLPKDSGQIQQVKVMPGFLRLAELSGDLDEIQKVNQLRWGYFSAWPEDLTEYGSAQIPLEFDHEMAHCLAAFMLNKDEEQLPIASLTLELVTDADRLRRNILKLAGLKRTVEPQELEPLPFPELEEVGRGKAVVVSAKWIAAHTFWGVTAVRNAFPALQMASIDIVKDCAKKQHYDIVGILAMHHPGNDRLLELRLRDKLHHRIARVRRAGRMVFRSEPNPDGSTTQRASFLPWDDFDKAIAALKAEAAPAYWDDGYPRLDRPPRTDHALRSRREKLLTQRRARYGDDYPTPTPPPPAPDGSEEGELE